MFFSPFHGSQGRPRLGWAADKQSPCSSLFFPPATLAAPVTSSTRCLSTGKCRSCCVSPPHPPFPRGTSDRDHIVQIHLFGDLVLVATRVFQRGLGPELPDDDFSKKPPLQAGRQSGATQSAAVPQTQAPRPFGRSRAPPFQRWRLLFKHLDSF